VLRTTIRALLLLGLMPATAFALGFGDIHLRSALNAPLDAEIEITATAEELAGVKATLAPRETFNRSGIEYPAFLTTATVKVGKSTDGRDVLRVQTVDPVTEPFLTMLVEVSHTRGKLVREYTVLLDPPVFANQTAAVAVAAPATNTQTRTGEVQRSPTTVATPAATSMPAASGSSVSNSGDRRSYRVQSGDTLSRIASGQFPGVDRKRALVAIYRANPAAFDGNMNVLHAGAQLALPADSDLAAVGVGEAAAEVSRQTQSWTHNTEGSGRLRLVPPEREAAASVSGAAATGTNTTLQSQVDQLQQKLQETQRLLELRNAELARLQSQAVTSGVSAAAPAAVAPPAATPAVVEPPTPEPAKTAEPAKAAAPAAAPATQSLLDSLLERWQLLAGVLLVLAAFLAFRWHRSRQSLDIGESLDRLSSHSFDRSAAGSQTLPVRVLPDMDSDSIVVEETGNRLRPGFANAGMAPGAASAQPKSVASEVPFAAPSAADTATALEQGDPLAEADFHMAYGLYDQAADLVKQAIARDPQRRELKLKLLEVFFVWGNKEQFLSLAQELAGTRSEAIPGEWEKILIMGRQIAADHSLFAGEAGTSAVARGGVDLNLEGGQNRVDFNLMGEPTLSPADTDGIDLDFGGAVDELAEPTRALRSPTEAGVDFVLDDPARGGDDDGRTREITQEITQSTKLQRAAALDATAIEQEGPTAELPEFDGSERGTIRLKLDGAAALGAMSAAGEQTAELALDDLGLDLGTMDVPSGVEPTLTEQSALDIVLQTAAQPQLNMDTASSSGSWVLDNAERVRVSDTAEQPATDATGLMHTMALKAIDLDLNAPDPSALSSSDIRRPDIRSDVAEAATASLPELDPPTMSEVGTKLDLARAYMDMGDPEGARSILDEVLTEGSASQKQEARRLMDSLPG
jgi:pilus assembly protein FimV